MFQLLLCTAALLLLGAASAQWDPATGHIQAPPGVPKFDPAPWNGAYKVTFSNLPKDKNNAVAGSDGWPYVPYWFNTATRCSSEGFDSTASSGVKLEDCFYRNNTGDTFDFWIKQSSLALQAANCYCYALNRFEGDFCSPGTSNGGAGRNRLLEKMTCPALHQAMTDDGAVPVTREQALSGQPDKGHYIAALARPDNSCVPGHCSESDYHFIRKDASGTWSFKFPRTPATDRDLEAKVISDPEAALLPGHYQVCGYYQVDPTKKPIGSTDPSPGPLASMYTVQRYINVPGVSIDISPSPYNPTTDAVMERGQEGILAEDLAWERKRGTKEYQDWLTKQREALELTKPSGKSSDEFKGTLSNWANGSREGDQKGSTGASGSGSLKAVGDGLTRGATAFKPASGRKLRFVM